MKFVPNKLPPDKKETARGETNSTFLVLIHAMQTGSKAAPTSTMQAGSLYRVAGKQHAAAQPSSDQHRAGNGNEKKKKGTKLNQHASSRRNKMNGINYRMSVISDENGSQSRKAARLVLGAFPLQRMTDRQAKREERRKVSAK